MKTAIFIPAYNAEKFLGGVIEKMPRTVAKKDIVVVDDGSKDGTCAAARKLGVTVIKHVKNRGYGGAQKTAYNYVIKKGYDIVIMVHADGQHNPLLIPKFVGLIERGCDAVTGTRFAGTSAVKQGMPLQRYVGNRLLSLFIRIMTGLSVSEMHNGYRAYKTDALRIVDFNSNSDKYEFDTEILLLLKAKNMKVGEVPIETIYKDEESHLNIFAYGSRLVKVVFRYVFLRKYRK